MSTMTTLGRNIILGVIIVLIYIEGSVFNKYGRSFYSVFFQPSSPSNLSNNEKENPFVVYQKFPIDLENASALFNTVHGALRQKDSNLNPNGLSFIPAYIPPNTLFYHSTSEFSIPQSFEWVAMSYEFSYSFASPGRKNNKLGDNKPYTVDVSPEGNKRIWKDKKYFYTFKNKAPLSKLIYLDGASASKSETRMDQHFILAQLPEGEELYNERVLADRICKWGKPFGLQGIIRLEIGFEIIICDFQRDLELIANTTLPDITDLLSFPDESTQPTDDLNHSRSDIIDLVVTMNSYEWLQSGSFVNDGEPRILLDFSKMISPINRSWIDPDPYTRRAINISHELKKDMISNLERSLEQTAVPYFNTDWQHLTDGIVDKFAPLLIQLNNTLIEFSLSKLPLSSASMQRVSEHLIRLTFNFVRRYTDSNFLKDDIMREEVYNNSITDYVSTTYPLKSKAEISIFSSIFRVQLEISTIIFDSFEVGKDIVGDLYVNNTEKNFERHTSRILKLKQRLISLLQTLRWTVFTQCNQKCTWDEICYVPTWGPGPLSLWSNYGKSYFYFDGETYRIESLACISYNDLSRMHQKSH